MINQSEEKYSKKQLIDELSRLKKSEFRYRTLLDYSSDPIFAFSADGTYQYVNQAFADGVNLSTDQIIYKKIWDVFSQDEADKRFAAVKWVFEHAEIKVLEVRVPRSEGDHFYLTTVKPVINEQGEVHTVICISKDITERKFLEEQLLTLSSKDLLTGLYNRNFFEVEMDRIQISRMFPVSIVVADMDNLKGINDRYGHAKGDEVLRRVADCIRQSFRAEDISARIGGDEFGIILPFTEHEPAMESVRRLKANLENQNDIMLRLSIGIATTGMEEQLLDVYKRADDQMYQEKMSRRISNKI